MKNEDGNERKQTVDDDNVLFSSILGSIVSLLVAVFVGLNKRNATSSASSKNVNCPFHCNDALHRAIELLTTISQKHCPCQQTKRDSISQRSAHVSLDDPAKDFEIISKSELENVNVIEVEAEGELTQTNITNQKGQFKIIEDSENMDIIRQDVNLDDALIFTTTLGAEKDTQTSFETFASINAPNMGFIVADRSTETDVVDVLNEALRAIDEPYTKSAPVVDKVKSNRDKEIQNKPETCCVCIQNNEENNFMSVPQQIPYAKQRNVLYDYDSNQGKSFSFI